MRPIVCLALLSACVQPMMEGAASPFGRPPALDDAHEAFLAGDVARVVSGVRDVLADPEVDAAVRDNALALWEAATRQERGRLPGDWELPAGVRDLAVDHVRKESPDGVHHELRVSGAMAAPDTLRQLRLTDAGGRVLADKQARLGEWDVSRDADGIWYDLRSPEADAAFADGLYFLDLDVASGATVHGWVILSRATASAAPALLSPQPGQHLATPNPELRWDDFRSPEHEAFEQRSLFALVAAIHRPVAGEGEVDWQYRWGMWRGDPARTSAVVGVDPDGDRNLDLAGGEHWVSLAFTERRRLGDVRVGRTSRIARTFFVDRAAQTADPRLDAAQTAAEAWLALVDAGRYGDSWHGAAGSFQGAVGAGAWDEAMRGVRAALGEVRSRRLASRTHRTSLPGAPDGEYVVLQYATSFAGKQAAVETITPALDDAGRWRVSGYFIR